MHNVPVYISVKQNDASWIALPGVKTLAGHQVQRLIRSCSTISLPLSISLTCIWSSEGSSDRDLQQAAKAGITDQGVSEKGQCLWGWVLIKAVCGCSVGELKSSNLFSRREKLHVTTSFMGMMSKVRPQPFCPVLQGQKKSHGSVGYQRPCLTVFMCQKVSIAYKGCSFTRMVGGQSLGSEVLLSLHSWKWTTLVISQFNKDKLWDLNSK